MEEDDDDDDDYDDEEVFLHVSMHLHHHLQEVISFYFAKVAKNY